MIKARELRFRENGSKVLCFSLVSVGVVDICVKLPIGVKLHENRMRIADYDIGI